MLEADEYVGDPTQYAIGAADKDYWTAPQPWVHQLRALGFHLSHNEYTNEQGEKIRYFSSEREVKLKSGEHMNVIVSGYTQPELEGQLGVSVGEAHESYSIWGSRPIKPNELMRVMRDIIRRLEAANSYDFDWGRSGTEQAVNKALRPYEFWRNERRKKVNKA